MCEPISRRLRASDTCRRSIALLGVLSAFAPAALAQFERAYGIGLEERSSWVIQATNGDYVHAGTRFNSANDTDVLIVRTDPAGAIIWDRRVGTPAFDIAHRVEQTNDGGFVVAGSTNGVPGLAQGILLMKVGPAGNQLWSFYYPGMAGDVSGLGLGLTEAANGDLLVCARYQLFQQGFAQQALIVFRTTPGGTLLWYNAYRDGRYGVNSFSSAMDIHELSDGTNRIAVSGYTANGFPSDFEAILALFTAGGAPLSAVAYNHLQFEDWASALDPAGNGDFLLAGFSKRIGEGGGTFLMRTTPAGVPIWYRTFRFFGVRHSMEELPNRDIIMAGSNAQQTNQEAALLRTNSAGTFQWCNVYGGIQQEYGEAVTPTSDGGLMLTAWTNSYGAGSFDFYACKTDAAGRDGCEEPFFPPLGEDQIPFEFFDLEPRPFDLFVPIQMQNVIGDSREDNPCRTGGCVDPPLGMVAWYPLDEPQGPTANEITYNNDGRHFNNPVPSPGMVAGALCFDGVQSYVEAPDAPQINFGTGDFSIDAWVRTSSAAGVQVICDKRTQDGTGTTGYSFFLANGQPGLQIADGSGSNSCSTAATASCTNYVIPVNVADGLWHHLAVTVNRASTTGITFYLDGAALTPNYDPTVRPGSITNTSVLRIGMRSFALTGGFNGCVDELEIFRRELTAAEVLSIFAAGPDGKCKDKCHVPWDAPFCAGATSVVVKIRICNCWPMPQTYTLSLAGLPANPPNCSIAGPTSFTILDPVPVTLAPGACTDIRVKIDRPVGMNAVYQVGCYDAIITNLSSGRVFHCHGSVQDRRDLCAVINPNWGSVLRFAVGRPRLITLPLTNTSGGAIDGQLRIRVIGPDMEPDLATVSLNGLPPGVPWVSNLMLAPGNEVDIGVDVLALQHEPLHFYTILAETDLDNDGTAEPLVSIGARTVPGGCPDEEPTADVNCDCTVDFFDIDPFLLALFDPTAYAETYLECPISQADINGDGAVDFFDIDPFLNCLFSGCP